MNHNWILDVLADLQQYARANGLAGIAAKASEAMKVAREELSETPEPGGDAGPRSTGLGRKAH